MVPIITWSPWKPVAIKKEAPYTESAIENGDSQYSTTCKIVKYRPKKIVETNAWEVLVELLCKRAWWAQVIVIPDEIKMIVLSKGIWNGLKGKIPLGGQIKPNSTAGARLLWKNAQKNEIKKNASEVINKIIPQRMLLETFNECSPWKVLSRVISRHHWYIVNKIIIMPTNIK